jgi:hypothetical protein
MVAHRQQMLPPTRARPTGSAEALYLLAMAACMLLAVAPVGFLLSRDPPIWAAPPAELYFKDLDDDVGFWARPGYVGFGFVVRNPDNRAHRYAYVVNVSRPGGATRQDIKKALWVRPHQEATVNATVRAPRAESFKVSVSLVGSSSNIHFWMDGPSR